jgi:hypothetical protein
MRHTYTDTDTHTHTYTLPNLNSRKRYRQKEVPGFVGAFTQTLPHTYRSTEARMHDPVCPTLSNH